MKRDNFYIDNERELFVFLNNSLDIKEDIDPSGDTWDFFVDNEGNKHYITDASFTSLSAFEYEEGTEEHENYLRSSYTEKGYTEIFPENP